MLMFSERKAVQAEGGGGEEDIHLKYAHRLLFLSFLILFGSIAGTRHALASQNDTMTMGIHVASHLLPCILCTIWMVLRVGGISNNSLLSLQLNANRHFGQSIVRIIGTLLSAFDYTLESIHESIRMHSSRSISCQEPWNRFGIHSLYSHGVMWIARIDSWIDSWIDSRA